MLRSLCMLIAILERNKIDATTRQQLTDFQFALLKFANDKDHLPAITSSDLCPWPIEILVLAAKSEEAGHARAPSAASEGNQGFWNW